eukprot:m.61097 g.61097  ORF g.61097 m.61097 type:complete len:59 (-) comp7979_c0_seq2:5265-5441(-)
MLMFVCISENKNDILKLYRKLVEKVVVVVDVDSEEVVDVEEAVVYGGLSNCCNTYNEK